MRLYARLAETAQHLEPVELGEHQIEQQHVRLQLGDQRERVDAVVGRAGDLHILFPRDKIAQKRRKIRVGIGDENAGLGFHNSNPPKIRYAGQT